MVHLNAQRIRRVTPDRLVWTGRDARPAGLSAGRTAGADIGIVRHVHGLQEVAGQITDACGKLAEVSLISAAEDVITGARRTRRRVGGECHHLIDHEFLLLAARQADDGAEIPQPAGHLQQLASVNPPGRQRLDGSRVRTLHKNRSDSIAQPPCEVPGQRLVGNDENASIAPKRKVAGFCLHFRRLQRRAQQTAGLVMRFLRVGVNRETGFLEIDEVSLETRANVRPEGIFEAGR